MTSPVGGAQGDLRIQNEERILGFVRDNPGCTQADIARAVRLTRAGVAKLIGTEPKKGEETTALRRVLVVSDSRPARYELQADLGCVITVDIGSKHIRLRLANLAGKQVVPEAEFGSPIDVVREPGKALDETARLMNDCLGRSGFALDQIAGLVIGVPFPVRTGGVVLSSGEWRYMQLPTSLWQRLDWDRRPPAMVRSDSDLGAMAEVDAAIREPGLELTRAKSHVVYVKWSSAITSSIVVRGELYRGSGGLAGQWPHTVLSGWNDDVAERQRCPHCGRICLNAVASLGAIADALEADDAAEELVGKDAEERARILVRRARDGDDRCAQLLQFAARSLGRSIGQVTNFFDPRLVVIGGAFRAPDYAYLAEAVHKGFEETVFKPAMNDVLIQAGLCTGSAAVRGGLVVALRRFAVKYLLGIPVDVGSQLD